MPINIQAMIQEIGFRNGVVLTIAPVGTGSIAIGNPSSGLEPDFAHQFDRQVRVGNSDEWESYTEESYTYRFFKYCTGDKVIPAYMNTAMDISVEDHIQVQAALQRWIDASVSKTINVPTEISREAFNNVYKLAYDSGCKGCTTYRPTEGRMSILSTGQPSKQEIASQVYTPQIPDRGDALEGTTYKIKWPSMSASVYVTINYLEGKPHEIFFATKDAKYQEWMTGLTLMISAIMRQGVDPSFIPGELKQVISTHDTAYHNKKFVGSLVARIGQVIEQDFIKHNIIPQNEEVNLVTRFSDTAGETRAKTLGAMCPSCGNPTLRYEAGCKKCDNCTYSAC
jgi:ribonucleoside-diphosphate reductase alpha chain